MMINVDLILGKKISSYMKLQHVNDKYGRSSRHQSPDPPPRHSRASGSETQSPLAMHRNFLETAQGSPSFSKR